MPKLIDFAIEHKWRLTIDRALLFHPSIRDPLYNVPVEFSLKLQTSAGYFWSKPPRIALHYGLQREGEHAMMETFLHETAHAMQWFVYKEINHGASWWEMMHQLGQKPVRTHNLAACARAKAVAPGNADGMGL